MAFLWVQTYSVFGVLLSFRKYLRYPEMSGDISYECLNVWGAGVEWKMYKRNTKYLEDNKIIVIQVQGFMLECSPLSIILLLQLWWIYLFNFYNIIQYYYYFFSWTIWSILRCSYSSIQHTFVTFIKLSPSPVGVILIVWCTMCSFNGIFICFGGVAEQRLSSVHRMLRVLLVLLLLLLLLRHVFTSSRLLQWLGLW